MLHLVLTTYNVARNEPSWLIGRLYLFHKFTIPSIKHQTNQDFIWIIFVDRNIPFWHFKSLQHHTIDIKNLVFAFITHKESYLYINRQVITFVNQFVPKTVRPIITTTIDSDDAIPIDYTQKLHEAASNQAENCIIDCRQFFAIDRLARKVYEQNPKYGHPRNSYCSITPSAIEFGDELQTSSISYHNRLGDFYPKRIEIDTFSLHTTHDLSATTSDPKLERLQHITLQQMLVLYEKFPWLKNDSIIQSLQQQEDSK